MASDLIERLDVDASRLELSRRSDLRTIAKDIHDAMEALAIEREGHAAARQDFHTMQLAADALRKRTEKAETALAEIANEPEVHTKLSQERLCCKFQDIAKRSLAARFLAQEEGR